MAGIGWRLERLIHQGVSGATAAYATGAAVMALPWVLTTALLVSLPALIGRDVAALTTARVVVSVAFMIALLVAGPAQIVISRYAADRLYEGRLRAIAGPLCRGIASAFPVCAITAALVLVSLRLPPRAIVWGMALSGTVGAQWIALSAGNGLCTPTWVLGSVGAGSVLSFMLAASLAPSAGLYGYLLGLVSGQALTLLVLLVGILRALQDEADERARLLPAFREYASLAGAGLAFNASLWVDKLITWRMLGSVTAMQHSSASTIAWFSSIPCLAWVYVEVETTFHKRFRRFFVTLESGASLAELRTGVHQLQDEAARLLRGAFTVQAGVTSFLLLAAPVCVRWAGLPPETLAPYCILLIAAGAQTVGLLGLILLYYFDLRREACIAGVGLLAGVAVFTVAAAAAGLPPSVGTALGCSLGAALIWNGVFRGIDAVLANTLLVQPYVVSERRRRRPIEPRSSLDAGPHPRRAPKRA